MRIAVIFTVLLLACGGKHSTAPEKTYAMTATMVSRDPAQNTITLDNKAMPGVMEAMRMDYPVRGANVTALPKDGAPVNAILHEQDGQYWVTDVKARK